MVSGGIIYVNNVQKGLVWSVTLKIGEHAGNGNSKCKLEQPIDKIVLFFKRDNVKFQFPRMSLIHH